MAEVGRQDFTEVDNNVTRHLPEELQRDDWNTMILHFLGLDHIGHKAGPGRYFLHDRQIILRPLTSGVVPTCCPSRWKWMTL